MAKRKGNQKQNSRMKKAAKAWRKLSDAQRKKMKYLTFSTPYLSGKK